MRCMSFPKKHASDFCKRINAQSTRPSSARYDESFRHVPFETATPYLGIFAYLITQSRGMAERSSQQAAQAREELRRVVGFSAADELEKLDRLKKSGSITDQEFARLRAKLVA